MGILAAFKFKADDSANRASAENNRRYTYSRQVGDAENTAAPVPAPASADDPTQHLPRVSQTTSSQ